MTGSFFWSLAGMLMWAPIIALAAAGAIGAVRYKRDLAQARARSERRRERLLAERLLAERAREGWRT